MTMIPVVENPRRRRRRRRLTAKQIRAGFGGKRRMGGTRRRRRRNPGLATLAANPTRRRSRRRYYSRPHRRRYRRRSYRNPKLFGIDFGTALWTAAGAVTAKALPGFIKGRLWSGMPTTGAMGLATKFGTVVLMGFIGNLVPPLRRSGRVNALVTGGMVAVLVDAYNEWLAPMLGIGGYVTDAELEAMGLKGYIETPSSLAMGAGMYEAPTQSAGSAYPVPLMAQ